MLVTLFVYGISVAILICAFFIGQQKPVRTLVTVLGILGVIIHACRFIFDRYVSIVFAFY